VAIVTTAVVAVVVAAARRKPAATPSKHYPLPWWLAHHGTSKIPRNFQWLIFPPNWSRNCASVPAPA
jgi:hypothetical protein